MSGLPGGGGDFPAAAGGGDPPAAAGGGEVVGPAPVQAQVVRAQEPQMEPKQEARLLIYPYLPLRRQTAGKHGIVSQRAFLHAVLKNHMQFSLATVLTGVSETRMAYHSVACAPLPAAVAEAATVVEPTEEAADAEAVACAPAAEADTETDTLTAPPAATAQWRTSHAWAAEEADAAEANAFTAVTEDST
ncbi:g9634 [Coccomyxa elongata]